MGRKCIVIPLDLGAVMASAFLLFNGQLYKKPISQPSAVVAASACGNIWLDSSGGNWAGGNLEAS